jgi:ABC-2 type transport system permease protein
MEATPAILPIPLPATTRVRRWLPYWAVLRTDLRQTLRSWVYRLWVVVSILAAVGYLLYRFGVHREAGIIQSASLHTSDLLRGIVLGSMALIVVLSVSSVATERGTLADSVLSRGISRYQYFMAKWHARTFAIVLTFVGIAAFVLLGSYLLLSEDLTFTGSVVAVATVALALAAIVAWGVTLGALSNSIVVGITILWIVLYGIGFVMTLLPASYPSPERVLRRLPYMLQGHYDLDSLGELAVVSFGLMLLAAIVGMIGFSRKDV